MADTTPISLTAAMTSPAPAIVPRPSLAGLPIGEILVRTESLAREKLEEALAAQRAEQAGVRLGEILVRLKAVDADAVLRALAVQLELSYLPHLDPADASAELAKKVPINFAKTAK